MNGDRLPAAETLRRRAGSLLLLVLLPACAALRPAPFQRFHASVLQAQTGLEKVMDQDVAWTRESDILALAEGPSVPLSRHLLKNVEGRGWAMDEVPLSWEARRTRRSLAELNEVFRRYTELLVKAAEGRVTEATFDAWSDATNDALRRWATEQAPTTKTKSDVAALASLSTEGLRTWVRTRRSRDLESVLRETQPWVEAYARHARGLVDLVRADLKAAYADQTEVLESRWSDKRAPGRATLARTLFNLNEDYVDAVESLESLAKAAAALPPAHAQLAARSSSMGSDALAELSEAAHRALARAAELEKAK